MKLSDIIKSCVVFVVLIGAVNIGFAENIDPNDDGSQYGYGENVGWLNFEPSQGSGVTVSETEVTGYVWAENIGWINLDPNDSDPNTGISNDGAGNLSGYAWGENVGWINFEPNVPGDSNDYGVKIDIYGNFSGWAWGENIGWVNFNSADLYGYDVKVCKVNFADLANFVGEWLMTGDLDADLSGDSEVDFVDYGVFADYWLDYCPDDWALR